jgi:nicotinamide mononucleotide transporter
MSLVELAAAVLVLVNVALVARRSVCNYPVGLAGVTLYASVFWQTKLYSDALLQVFFFGLNLYGWAMWSRAKALKGEVLVLRMSVSARVRWMAFGLVATLGWAAMMARWTDAAAPWWDAAVAVPSVVAQAMLARRWLENWWVWIAVDATAIGLFAWKELWVTSALYVLLLAMAVWGMIRWRGALREQPSA